LKRKVEQSFEDLISFRSSSAKEKLREDSLKYLTKDRILQLIEEGFETAKAPVCMNPSAFFSRAMFLFFSLKNITVNHQFSNSKNGHYFLILMYA
jgi:hypothetical protein